MSQSGLKEEKLPPSPIMRGEQFNPAMRPDHHKHADNKPSQPGHSQQSEHLDSRFNHVQSTGCDATRHTDVALFYVWC